ncbi:MAG: hypothetical protein H7831_12590 [Magnetococcus sp. WYHC-3]
MSEWLSKNGHKAFMILLVAGFFALALGKRLYPTMFEGYTGVKNAPLTYETSRTLSPEGFEHAALKVSESMRRQNAELATASESHPFARRVKTEMLMTLASNAPERVYPHIQYFRDAGIRRYEGPSTCVVCHDKMRVPDGKGGHKEVDTLEDVVNTVHFKFQSMGRGFSTFGYDGREVNAEGRPIPLGKIDRACGIPGSFSWTGWAKLVTAKPGSHDPADPKAVTETYSEGCGQCHIGGNYHPATEKMMPVGDVPASAKQGVDCLICHADQYDMNYRYVIDDGVGLRWNQDRRLEAAMTVGQPTAKNCLYCHQHNLGGDTEKGLPEWSAPSRTGYKNKRILHPGAKRGNPWGPNTDVHAAAGMQCTDCHEPEGHKIPRGVKGVDLVANDLPHKLVECENCHTASPHVKATERAILNGHVDRLACETCHVLKLRDDNVVLRDWVHPVWNEHEGLWLYRDILQSGDVGIGFTFLWANGSGTFLANALGDNPTGDGSYNPLMEQLARIDHPEAVARIRKAAEEIKQQYPDLDVDAYVQAVTNTVSQLTPEMLAKRQEIIDTNVRPVMKRGKSKLAPFKLFNAIMYEDMGNQGPFGAMILPFDYPVYFETGKPMDSMVTAIQHPIVKRMYELPFKEYMMDEFMRYFGIPEWNPAYPLTADGQPTMAVEAHWMRQMGSLYLNHGIQKNGRKCEECHAEKGGVMPFEKLGYSPERVEDLRTVLQKRAAAAR